MKFLNNSESELIGVDSEPIGFATKPIGIVAEPIGPVTKPIGFAKFLIGSDFGIDRFSTKIDRF